MSFLSDVVSARNVVIGGLSVLFAIAVVTLWLTGRLKRFKHRHDPGARYEGRNQKKRYQQELKTRQAIQAAQNVAQPSPAADDPQRGQT
jgi:hypothetical protein